MNDHLKQRLNFRQSEMKELWPLRMAIFPEIRAKMQKDNEEERREAWEMLLQMRLHGMTRYQAIISLEQSAGPSASYAETVRKQSLRSLNAETAAILSLLHNDGGPLLPLLSQSSTRALADHFEELASQRLLSFVAAALRQFPVDGDGNKNFDYTLEKVEEFRAGRKLTPPVVVAERDLNVPGVRDGKAGVVKGIRLDAQIMVWAEGAIGSKKSNLMPSSTL